MNRVEEFEFNGYKATIIIPNYPNKKWIWKTEFFYAFDKAEQVLNEMGYTRVYYQVSDMYGCDKAIRLMHNFHLELLKRYDLDKEATLFGFSRGGLYAFNYALYYSEYVNKIYLDAPVLNLKSWPVKESNEYYQMLDCYNLNKETYDLFKYSPIDKLDEFARLNIPVLIVAGAIDTTVPIKDNCEIMIDYYKAHNLKIDYILKKDCDHHPHSLDDVSSIIEFVMLK